MSQSIYFFVRCENKFLLIGAYPCGHPLFDITHYGIPYERIIPITKDRINNWLEFAEVEKASRKDIIAERNHAVDVLMKASNSFEEKINYVNEVEDWNKESKEEIDLISDTICYFNFLLNIIDGAEVQAIANKESINFDEYIYVGIEIDSPTVNDIK